ncbi:conserved oligomeric Golgi complex subunit 1 isoform X1 [Dendroctonus ponderosae]|uniref:conserved oligomeric Golgi complex subunit 1 isoform X1 n=1 Tax=Dendroctonus ponderosae TaxID=77166 RepID=UPI002034F077|nr:conserved oligomeric Golgi complex subunit 1 isoform X1 [Dendroctonus ponderosae]
MNRSELTHLDVVKLFEERSVDEIVEIEKLLDGEIERKRNDLRSMVGDRYKDILAASDAIKSMKTISEDIVSSIEEITKTCEMLMETQDSNESTAEVDQAFQKQSNEERVLLIQVRLAIFLNEQIWVALDGGRNLEATQYYLLAQHIYMGLNFTKKEYLGKLPLLGHLKLNLVTLRAKIFEKVTQKLESVEIDAEETSQNLNALMLIENQTNDQLLNISIEHRKTALQTVINSQYSSVRFQIAAMVKCLITTVLLLHDCFVCKFKETASFRAQAKSPQCPDNDSKSGLLWKQLDSIVGPSAPATLSKLELPPTPLIAYVPEIIKQFRPKLKLTDSGKPNSEAIDATIIHNWLETTQKIVQSGLEKSLQLLTTVKGLYLVREESLKIELCSSWGKVCGELQLPDHFDVWYYFFQKLLTARARGLISTIIQNSMVAIQADIDASLKYVEQTELDLRWYAWKEESEDVSKFQNDHAGLTMKARGFSSSVVNLCAELDKRFLELLEDISQYLSGQEFSPQPGMRYLPNDYKFKRKFVDQEELRNYLMDECTQHSLRIIDYVNGRLSAETGADLVAKSLFCARFLQACCSLCANFRQCCEFAHVSTEWQKVCDHFMKTSHSLWHSWLESSAQSTTDLSRCIRQTGAGSSISQLSRWDEIEIQEQAEEKTFKSQIKVPLKPSIPLSNVLVMLNEDLSKVLPYTLPKSVHLQFIERNMYVILREYEQVATEELNQNQALQALLDVRFLATLCVPRENTQMVKLAQTICDKLRSKIDPFDLNVFYSYLQNNVRKAVSQSQTLFGCLLPSTMQLMNLGAYTKAKEQEKNPSLMAVSAPSTNAWFPLLPITVPSQKLPGVSQVKPESASPQKPTKSTTKKAQESASAMRQSAAALFGSFSTDWFS